MISLVWLLWRDVPIGLQGLGVALPGLSLPPTDLLLPAQLSGSSASPSSSVVIMENVDGKRKPSGGLVNNYLFKKAIKHSYACIDIIYDASDNDHYITRTFKKEENLETFSFFPLFNTILAKEYWYLYSIISPNTHTHLIFELIYNIYHILP